MAIVQHALTVVAPIRGDVSDDDVARLKALEKTVHRALKDGVPTLHFARFVILPDEKGKPAKLAFESNHDGARDVHLRQLARALAAHEDALFGLWKGYEKGRLEAFVEANAKRAQTFYLGHPGLSAPQIANDDRVRHVLTSRLDALDAARKLKGLSAKQIRDRILAEPLSDEHGRLVAGEIDRGLPPVKLAECTMWGIGIPYVLGALPLAPGVLVSERLEARAEARRKPELLSEGSSKLDAIIAHEDTVPQNGLTHYVPLRAGLPRKLTMRAVLGFLELARRFIAFQGTLGGISSIHFARWVILEDDTVLFLSNYDGSWESYLGDFVDKAHDYLTAVWSNTKWFPRSSWLFRGGASQEAEFKQWVRTFQVPNQIWYSAYPRLTVQDVLRNEEIRTNALRSTQLEEGEARAWLAKL